MLLSGVTLLLSLYAEYTSAFPSPHKHGIRTSTGNDGIQLAVTPNCGTLSGSPADVNAGLGSLSSYKNIVAFGDSYTAGGISNGSLLEPAVLIPPNPEAGGRISNGPVWVENLATDIGARLWDYAVNDAFVDTTQWLGITSSGTDFVNQVNLFTGQEHGLDPDTTLYVVFFGMEDFQESQIAKTQSTTLTTIGDDVLYNLLVLTSSPTFAKNILVVDNYGRGTESAAGDAYKQTIFNGLNVIRTDYKTNFGFVDLKTVWDGVLGTSPGYAAFGYTSPGACTVNTSTIVGACSDPDHTFYWIPGNPSKQTHRIVADYVEEALAQCTNS